MEGPKEDRDIVFVALISRDDKPLFIESYDPSNDANRFLKYNFFAHMALDIFLSPTAIGLREQQQQNTDSGGVVLLFIQDDVAVYGYETNNGLRIVVGFSDEVADKTLAAQVRPSRSLKDLFLRIHKCYLKVKCNPFTVINEDESELLAKSTSFAKGMGSIVDSWNEKQKDN